MKQRTFMQKALALISMLFVFYTAGAQFYYNDVVDLRLSNQLYASLIANNVKAVTATSKDSDGSPTEGFAFSRTITNGGNTIITHTELAAGGVYDEADTYVNGRLTQSQDSADNVRTTVRYSYDAAGNPLQVQTQTDDTAMGTHSTEVHAWFYTAGVPDSMIRIKDQSDSTVVRFKKDDNNNVAEEIWLKKGRVGERYFYYYNEAGQLTDIVRFNNKAQRMLPDFLFEYDENGRLAAMTPIPQGSSDYVTWKYVYDERGLKVQDVLFNKRRELLGMVSYTYR